MSVELSVQAPLERQFDDVFDAIRRGLLRFANRTEIDVRVSDNTSMVVQFHEAAVQVFVSHFDYEPEEAGLWCNLDGGLYRDMTTYGLIVVLAEILADELSGKIVDESNWLSKGRIVDVDEIKAICHRIIGTNITEKSLADVAKELKMSE